MGVPRRVFVAEGDHIVLETHLAAGCHVLAALGVTAVGDLDLALHDTGGMLLREDVERDAVPAVRFCPPADATAYAVLVSRTGGGEVVLADLGVPASLAVDVADALGERDETTGPTPDAPAPPAQRAPPLPGPPDSAVPAAQAIGPAAQDLLELGYVASLPDLSGTLEHGRAAVQRVDLSAGLCYVIQGAADGSVHDLDLRIMDERGTELARDTATDPRPRLRVCPERSGPFRLEVRMFDGDGAYVVRTLALATLADAPSSLPPRLRQRWAELAVRMRARGFALRQPLERADLVFTSRQVHHVPVHRGTCYAFAAVAAEGDLDLSVIDEDGAVLVSDTGDDASPTVTTCPRDPETLEVEVKLYRAQGQYVLGVWVSPPEDA